MVPGRRRSSRAQSGFPTKENPWGVGFGHRRPPAKQQGPGSRGSPGPVRPMESRGPGTRRPCIAFSNRGAFGLWFAARGEFPFAECSCQKLVWGRRCDGASALSGGAGSEGMAGAWAHKALAHPILLPHEGEPMGCGFRAPETPSKAAGPREPGQPSPGSPYGERGPGAKTACNAFSIRGALGLWFAARGEFPFAECS